MLEEVVPYAAELAFCVKQAHLFRFLLEVLVPKKSVSEVVAVGLNDLLLAGEVRSEVSVRVERYRLVLVPEPVFGSNVVDMGNGIGVVVHPKVGVVAPVYVAWDHHMTEARGGFPIQDKCPLWGGDHMMQLLSDHAENPFL